MLEGKELKYFTSREQLALKGYVSLEAGTRIERVDPALLSAPTPVRLASSRPPISACLFVSLG